MNGRRKARGYTRPPFPDTQLTPTQPGIADDSPAYRPVEHAPGINEDSAGYFPLPSPVNFPLPRGIWEESPLYRVLRETWVESPGYMPGPSPGYHPIPPVNPDDSPGYSPGPSPGYAPVPSGVVNTPFNRQADMHRTPRTPQAGFLEIVGPIIVPEAGEEVRTVRNEGNVGPSSPENDGVLNARRHRYYTLKASTAQISMQDDKVRCQIERLREIEICASQSVVSPGTAGFIIFNSRNLNNCAPRKPKPPERAGFEEHSC
ncbi:hypothetical protein R1sor_004500 [Riccia sorocarpa]|uniref:Uncharacterized protein n=1 Tax=Riccia sorocarpa TaxID=122646 RepID=A0ABD3HKW2_9MARC